MKNRHALYTITKRERKYIFFGVDNHRTECKGKIVSYNHDQNSLTLKWNFGMSSSCLQISDDKQNWHWFFFTLLSHTSTPVSNFGYIDRPWSSNSICASGLLLPHLYQICLNTYLVSRLLRGVVSSSLFLSYTSTPVSRFRFIDLDPAAVFMPVAYFFDT